MTLAELFTGISSPVPVWICSTIADKGINSYWLVVVTRRFRYEWRRKRRKTAPPSTGEAVCQVQPAIV